MESFRLEGDAGRAYTIRVDEVDEIGHELIRTLIDIDLQTFSESTFSHYTAAAFLRYGRVYLLYADDVVIGTCVCMRAWERPSEALLLSMGIRPGWRGRGLGQHFVNGVLERLRQRGLRAVSLLVGADNRRAVKVYRDVGFDAEEEFVQDPRTNESLLLMRCKLQDEAPVTTLPPVEDR